MITSATPRFDRYKSADRLLRDATLPDGLEAETLANFNRLPREPERTARSAR